MTIIGFPWAQGEVEKRCELLQGADVPAFLVAHGMTIAPSGTTWLGEQRSPDAPAYVDTWVVCAGMPQQHKGE